MYACVEPAERLVCVCDCVCYMRQLGQGVRVCDTIVFVHVREEGKSDRARARKRGECKSGMRKGWGIKGGCVCVSE